MSDEQEQERDAAVIAEMRNLLTAATPGNWRFKTFSTAMDGDEEIGELTTDGPVVCDVMWATGDWKGKSDWLEFRSEADKVLIERAKEHAETLLRECDRLTAERDAARAEVERLRAGIMELKRVNDKNIEWCRNQLPRPTAMEVDEVEAILRTHEWFGSCIRATLETGDTDVR